MQFCCSYIEYLKKVLYYKPYDASNMFKNVNQSIKNDIVITS